MRSKYEFIFDDIVPKHNYFVFRGAMCRSNGKDLNEGRNYKKFHIHRP